MTVAAIILTWDQQQVQGRKVVVTAVPGLLQAGAFRIGDTAGTLENIVACKLYRPGSVGFVSKSGGMSNEMYNVLSRATNGLYEGKPACPAEAGKRWEATVSVQNQ